MEGKRLVEVKPITDDRIEYWVKLVNSEYNLSDKNEYSIEYFKRLKPYAELVDNDKYYVVLLESSDMWGNKELSVISWYIKPEFRTIKYIMQLQADIISVAKFKKVKYIYQGSHLGDKLFKLLGKIGYKTQTMRYEV